MLASLCLFVHLVAAVTVEIIKHEKGNRHLSCLPVPAIPLWVPCYTGSPHPATPTAPPHRAPHSPASCILPQCPASRGSTLGQELVSPDINRRPGKPQPYPFLPMAESLSLKILYLFSVSIQAALNFVPSMG